MTKSQEDDHSTPSSEQVEKAEHGGTPPLDVNYNTHAVKGDDSDGVVDWTWRHAVASISLAGLYVGAQIPLYFVGGSLTYIVKDIGSSEKSSWLPIANTLTIAVVAPFVGYLQDLFGRRYISLAGGVTILIGVILVGTTHTFGQAVVGMSLAGAGAAVGELTALAGIAELVPVKKRGFYLALVTFFVIPFVPYVMYGQILSAYHTWRWGMWISLIYNGICLAVVALTYFPQSHRRGEELPKMEILKSIDYVGAFLSIVGLTLFLVALQAGGYSHPWSSAYVLSLLLVGIVLIITFCVWEAKFAKFPMVPGDLFKGQRVVAVAFLVAFVGGLNFYSSINFYPLEALTVFDPEPVQVGLKGLASGLGITIGATVINGALSWFKGNARELLLFSCVMMTAFGGALAAVTPDTPALIYIFGVFSGVGVGGVLVPPATVAITVAPDELIATCVALSLSIRVVGGSIGYSIYYNIFYHKLKSKLPYVVADYAIAAGLPITSATQFVTAYILDPSALASVPGVTPEILKAAAIGSRWGYAYALKYVWLTSIAFGVCAIVACAFIGNTKKYMTNRIAARIAH
ncbi:related to MFS drug efflux pump [Fusarium fujikuroi]|uniref:Related to MFS drug efflux pump n=2 Tax=Fusarium fujikuroi TaxID=5127 RepID=S0E4H9_GIBF5|nr:related to MFS drug efflux pump [Fusarium fujikuroi IMI 58289]KLP08555.1 MFS drug efflux pump [Fusarium fujikuroi]KLP15920.1 MFS drug efflux pump [Fusarium fujikuroi]QGI65373.1 hypothetical protein CEK27_009344 [Fusarium fujikuroi]QGI96255.1 hypothetical protein CEK26_009324 [Fusarium fujikuroi]CCT69545.1 related to MFS drug efflux pump [Fusarium fujikuroi IMI 58289]